MKARYLFRVWKARWRDHRAELGALLGAIRPGDVALDIGAHKGSFLYSLARAAAPGRVIAFEPQPALADYLKQVKAAFRMDNVTVEPAAVSDHEGEAVLHIPGTGNSPGASLEGSLAGRQAGREVRVRVTSLDTYLAGVSGRVAAMKIDVEGHELALFRGAQKILRQHGPLLVFECENRHMSGASVYDVLNFLRELGYDGHFVRRGKLAPLAEFDAGVHQRQTAGDFWNAPDYCNNFVLRRRP